MRGYVRVLKRRTNEILLPQLAGMVREAYGFRPDARFDDDTVGDPLIAGFSAGTWYGRLTRAMDDIVGTMEEHGRHLWDLAKQYGRRTSTFNAKQFHVAVRNAMSVDIFKSEPWLVGEMHAWEAENLRLIRSIPSEHVAKLQGRVVQALREGQSTAQIVKAVREGADVTESRAELIAEDQIGKLNGQLTRLRQQGIGVTEAVWRGVLDRRERPTHRALEGVQFSWKNPPRGGPGAEIRCRCWAAAVFPELKDIDGTVVP